MGRTGAGPRVGGNGSLPSPGRKMGTVSGPGRNGLLIGQGAVKGLNHVFLFSRLAVFPNHFKNDTQPGQEFFFPSLDRVNHHIFQFLRVHVLDIVDDGSTDIDVH